jgi:hypothetical protein
VKFGNELKHELPTAEVGLDPRGSGYIGSGCHRCRSLHSGIGSASRRMGARRQRANRARRRHRRKLSSGGAGALEAADLVEGPTLRVEKTTSSSAGGSLTRMLAQDRFAN